MAAREEKLGPFVTSGSTFDQNVGELASVGNMCNSDHSVKIDPVEQPIKCLSVGSGHMSHRQTPAFNDHLDHCLIAFQQCWLNPCKVVAQLLTSQLATVVLMMTDITHPRRLGPDAALRSDAAELKHQRQLTELMQQMQQQMRQMQHQAHEVQTQQGAPPSGGNERQSKQLTMKGFDKIEVFSGGEEQWAELVLEDQDCCVGDEWRSRGDTDDGRSGRSREH